MLRIQTGKTPHIAKTHQRHVELLKKLGLDIGLINHIIIVTSTMFTHMLNNNTIHFLPGYVYVSIIMLQTQSIIKIKITGL